jgi:predicted HTH transcriptional regulator
MIINHEIESISQFLRNQSAEGVSRAGYILSDKFFSTDMPPIPEVRPRAHVEHITSANGGTKTEKKALEVKKKDVKDKKNTRQSTILDLLKKESNLTIKDFVRVIKDCSEKTIQRELIDLVEKGVVKKEGERRWSTYSLNLTF